jgi:hypothetical protein
VQKKSERAVDVKASGCEGDEKGIPQDPEGTEIHNIAVAIQTHVRRDENGRATEYLILRLERGAQHPDERQNHEEGDQG